MPSKKSRRAAQDVARAFIPRKLPAFFTPMMALRAHQLPEGDEWTYELKLDGYRALLFKDGARVSLRSRNDKDLAIMYPSVVADGGGLNANQAVVDGEIVAVDHVGRPSFQALQHRGSHPKHTIVFYAFDLPYVDGIDLMKAPLEERRAKLLEITTGSRVLFSHKGRTSRRRASTVALASIHSISLTPARSRCRRHSARASSTSSSMAAAH